MLLTAVVLVALATQSSHKEAAETAHQEALEALAGSRLEAAEASVRKAIELSAQFVPEEEIDVAGGRKLLFEDMILEARDKYRERRWRVFETLGRVLAARQDWQASRKAYRRAIDIEPQSRLFLAMLEQPDLRPAERTELLLAAAVAPDVRGPEKELLEKRLLDSGAFRSRAALDAGRDRLRARALLEAYPDTELSIEPFPDLRVTTDAGNLIAEERFRLGSTMVLYWPIEGCARCSEELDAVNRGLAAARARGALLEVTSLVPEADLPIARRIVRLLAAPVGVGRVELLPDDFSYYPGGEIRIVARGGLTQFRIPLSTTPANAEIRRQIEAIVAFLDPILTEEARVESMKDVVRLPVENDTRAALSEWIDRLEILETGPASLRDLYRRLDRMLQTASRDVKRDDLLEMLGMVSRLRGAPDSKQRLLGALAARLSPQLLDEAKKLDPNLVRSLLPAVGFFHTAVEGKTLLLQRSFQAESGLRHFNFVLEDSGEGIEILWAGAEEHLPDGAEVTEEGAVFRFLSADGCSGVRLVTGRELVFDGCPARVIDGRVYEAPSALVDGSERPAYYRRVAGTEETVLERGLRLFSEGSFASAAAAFEEAASSIDPIAPYDESDLRYNRARALEEAGKRQEALALYRSIGDVSYQELVDAGAGRIEGAPRQ